jgi:plasmid maintenance system antidote protein VapI
METNKATEIKVALLRLDITQSKIADDLGVSVQIVNAVIHGRRTSKRISAHIKQLTDKTPTKKAA